MAEPRRRDSGERTPGTFDRELDLRGIWTFTAILAVAIFVVHLVVWGLLAGFRETAARRDPRPSPLQEANAPRLPPEPRLQSDPVRDMVRMRSRENAILTSYGWVDRAAGVGRIPVDRAMALILERGLPEVSAPSAESPTPSAPRPKNVRAPRPHRRTGNRP